METSNDNPRPDDNAGLVYGDPHEAGIARVAAILRERYHNTWIDYLPIGDLVQPVPSLSPGAINYYWTGQTLYLGGRPIGTVLPKSGLSRLLARLGKGYRLCREFLQARLGVHRKVQRRVDGHRRAVGWSVAVERGGQVELQDPILPTPDAQLAQGPGGQPGVWGGDHVEIVVHTGNGSGTAGAILVNGQAGTSGGGTLEGRVAELQVGQGNETVWRLSL